MHSLPIFDLMADQLIKQLGDRQFFTLRELTDIGVFGSLSHARDVLKAGNLSFIKISSRRSVIPRVALLDYLQNNLSENLRIKGESCSPR